MLFDCIPRLVVFCGGDCLKQFEPKSFTGFISTTVVAVRRKNDIKDVVTKEEAMALCNEYNLPFFEMDLEDSLSVYECVHNAMVEALPAVFYKRKKEKKCIIN